LFQGFLNKSNTHVPCLIDTYIKRCFYIKNNTTEVNSWKTYALFSIIEYRVFLLYTWSSKSSNNNSLHLTIICFSFAILPIIVKRHILCCCFTIHQKYTCIQLWIGFLWHFCITTEMFEKFKSLEFKLFVL